MDLLSKYKWSLGARWFCQQMLSKDESMRPTAAEASRDTWIPKACAAHDRNTSKDLDKVSLQQLQKEYMKSHLMRMALSCITSQLNLSQMHHMNLRFKQYDGSGDGRLSHVEMRAVLEDVGLKNGDDMELIIESLDSDHSGLIEYSEFVAGCLDLGEDDVKSHLEVVFGIFDLDGSGSISLQELREVLTQGPNSQALSTRPNSRAGHDPRDTDPTPVTILPDGKTAEQVMEEMDCNHTHKVELKEFEKYLLAEHKRVGEQLHASKAAAANQKH